MPSMSVDWNSGSIAAAAGAGAGAAILLLARALVEAVVAVALLFEFAGVGLAAWVTAFLGGVLLVFALELARGEGEDPAEGPERIDFDLDLDPVCFILSSPPLEAL